jgi:catalase
LDRLARQALDAVHGVFGRHEGYRAVHAKGLFARGRFTPSERAAELTTAAHMQHGAVDVLARFSNASGDPQRSDAARVARGLAVKLTAPGGAATDVVATSAPRFYTRTPEDFVAFTRAGTGPLAPLKLIPFLVRHPEVIGALADVARIRPPVSYATSRYNSLHAFAWVDRAGTRRNLRYRWLPVAGEEYLAPRAARELGGDYLARELADRLARDAVEFELRLVMAADGDPLDDANVAWPEDREQVLAGRLELTDLAPEAESDGRIVVFDPTRVIEGIELSDDPILRFRPRVYSLSAEARSAAAAGTAPRG